MKRRSKVFAGVLAVTFLLASVFFVFRWMTLHQVKTGEEEQNINRSVGEAFALPTDYETSDQFVILEIVPDMSYAQLGYWTAGNEPYNPFEACYNGDLDSIKWVVGNENVTEKKSITEDEYEQLRIIYGDALLSQYVTGPAVTGGQKKYTFCHKDDKGEEKEFTFLMNKNLLNTCLKDLMDEKSVDQIKVITVTTQQLNNCDASKLPDFLEDMDLVVMNQTYLPERKSDQKKLVKTYSDATVADEDKNFLDTDLNWNVVNIIFKQIAKKKNPLPVMMDSSIYTKALDAESAEEITTYQYKLDRSVKFKDNKSVDSYTLYGNKGLFNTTEWSTGANQKASENNTYKLYLMSMFRDPVEFYNLFIESGIIESKADGTYATCKLQSDAKAWNITSFLPCKGDVAGETEFAEADEDYWKNTMAIALDLPQNNYVNCNVMSFDAGKSMIDLLNTSESYAYSDSDQTPQKDLKTVLQEDVLTYQPKARLNGRAYRVLDIEPACSTKTCSLKAEDIEKMIPYTSYTKKENWSLDITRMSTAEFIGHSEDLISTYDLIYIGDDITGLHCTSDGKQTNYGTVETNADMKGVIYAHVGAAVVFEYDNKQGKGLLSESGLGKANGYALFAKSGDADRPFTGKLRYSGNDITKLKKTQVSDYIDSGLPVIVAGKLMTGTDSAPKDDYFNDRTYNNMYQLLTEKKSDIMSMGFNYRLVSKSNADTYLARLTVNKPVLSIESISYSPAANESSGVKTITDWNKNIEYEFDSTTQNRKITFNYKITDSDYPGSDYICKLYIDKNADGTYTQNEQVGTTSYVSAGGNTYSCTIQLNSLYRGPFTWKLELTAKRNEKIKCMQNGYGTIRDAGTSDKKIVNILQVQARTGEIGSVHSTSWGKDKAQQVHLSSDSEFKTLINGLKDYDLKITETTLDKAVNASANSEDDINKYDMVIFGFADSYRDLDMTEEFAKKLEQYIKDGHSVLFTHDLTSQINDDGIFSEKNSSGDKDATSVYMETTNGKFFNRYLRDAMGLNRFGQKVRAGDTEFNTVYDQTGTSEQFGFTYTTLMQYSNFRHTTKPDSDKGGKPSSGTLHDYLGPYEYLYVNFKSDNPGWPDIKQGYKAHYVSNVNDGQITKYPFDLSTCTDKKTAKGSDGQEETRYKIADTHGQYYQLNLESEDVKCWYTLTDGDLDGDKFKNQGWYSASQKDAANNYYIYSKGNVTYSGVGHSTSSEMTDFERKLFINTMVAALRAGIEGPKVHITNGYNIPDSDIPGEDRYVVFADVDADAEDEDFAKKEDVEFYVSDDSAKASDKYMYLTLEVDNGTPGNPNFENVNQEDYKIVAASGSEAPKTGVTYTKKDGTTVVTWKLQRSDFVTGNESAKKYILQFPRKQLENQGYQNLKLTVYNTDGAFSSEYGAVMRLELYPLD